MKNLNHFFCVFAVFAALNLFAHSSSSASADQEKCYPFSYETTFHSNFLTDSEKAALRAGQQINKFIEQPNGYFIGYVFRTSSFDPELIAGIFSHASEHAGNMGKFMLKSRFEGDGNLNPFRVFYEQQVNWPYDNAEYVVENTTAHTSEGGYIVSTTLVSSSDASFSPQSMDAYVMTVAKDHQTLVVACNYTVPKGNSFKGLFNSTAHDRLIEGGENLLQWVIRVGQSGLASNYRWRLSQLLQRR